MRDDDLGCGNRLAVLVTHGDLALGIGTEHRFLACMPRLGNQAQDLVTVVDRGRHKLGRILASKPEHDALIAGALIAIAATIDALGDVAGLGVQQHPNIGPLPMKALLLVADILDGHARNVRDQIPGDALRAPGFAGNNHLIGGCQRLACDPELPGIDAGLRPFAEKQIDDLVGNAVANLVGMPLRHRFTGKEIRLSRHSVPHS